MAGRPLEDLNCIGVRVLLLLLLLLLLFLGSAVVVGVVVVVGAVSPTSRPFSIALSLSSNMFSMSAMMESIAAWVIGAPRISCGMPVELGALEVVVLV